MAKKRDVIIAIVIAASFVMVIGFFGLAMFGMMSDDGGSAFGSLGGKVGVIEMFGIIDQSSGRPVIRQLDRWRKSSSIKAVVLHINSPGGGTAISQEIYDAVGRLSDEKPVVAAMAEVAASGGLMIACAADRIVANRGTLTGSIGTIMSFNTFVGAMDKLGIESETIKSGEFKDVGSYSRKMGKKEELMLRSVVMDGYEQFIDVVAEGRGMDREEVYAVADGSVFTGMQAYNLGLVDTLGGLTEAIDLAAELAGLEPDPDIVRPRKREKFYLSDFLTGLLGDLTSQVQGAVSSPGLLYLYR